MRPCMMILVKCIEVVDMIEFITYILRIRLSSRVICVRTTYLTQSSPSEVDTILILIFINRTAERMGIKSI